MAYLGTIVRHLETAFHVKVHGQFHTRTEIEGTRFLTPEQETDPEYGDKLLYVACSRTGATAWDPQAAAPFRRLPNILLTGHDTPRTTPASYTSGKPWMPARYSTPSRRSSSGIIR